MTGLNLLRAGKGQAAGEYLKRAGIVFTDGDKDDLNFNGLTLTIRRGIASVINAQHYKNLAGAEVTYKTKRWGQQRPDWRDIPESISLKIGAGIMIVRNLYEDQDGQHRLV